ncbi:DUF2627 domain-containing protein [Paenibacillus turpanensis]|uniref:DUF2627 domain-containing protein n=1 Tax=Paenibacillus turpanensis TaxID=2689078 RepID=UPI00140D4072|nr:DUF2627 domain-containing protein [Paenibacillus turpanensis]
MNQTLQRFIAVILLALPGLSAAYGFLLMKDAVFASFGPNTLPWLKLIIGFILFAIGVAFIAGWIFFRDRKRNYVAPRFREKKPRRPKQ